MVKHSPIYCGRCAENGYSANPPTAPDCLHFSGHDSDTIWLAAGGGVILDALQRNDRRHTKYYLHTPIDHPTHPVFHEVVREKNRWSRTFKLPIVNEGRIHYEETPHEDWFASLHGPEFDPDPPATLQQQILHGLEVAGHGTATFRERARLGNSRYQDPLYIYPDHREVALDHVRPINRYNETNRSAL